MALLKAIAFTQDDRDSVSQWVAVVREVAPDTSVGGTGRLPAQGVSRPRGAQYP